MVNRSYYLHELLIMYSTYNYQKDTTKLSNSPKLKKDNSTNKLLDEKITWAFNPMFFKNYIFKNLKPL